MSEMLTYEQGYLLGQAHQNGFGALASAIILEAQIAKQRTEAPIEETTNIKSIEEVKKDLEALATRVENEIDEFEPVAGTKNILYSSKY